MRPGDGSDASARPGARPDDAAPTVADGRALDGVRWAVHLELEHGTGTPVATEHRAELDR